MGQLKVLPSDIANLIAAGEVVQRPSSVVKELMENSVDAGAGSVNVIVSDAGRTLIQVIDNGCGMSPEDARLCFERHATSKISSAEDLEGIHTYGFRGEALASIAAVAEVTLKTRRKEDQVGVQIIVGSDSGMEEKQVATPVGSNFCVRNLFFRTPARRKFLKSDNVEFKHIVEEFTRVALTRPETGFTLSHNGRDVYVLKPAMSLKYRILDLMGASVTTDIVDIASSTSMLELSGFIGKPDAARKTPGNQFFFVNGRFFRSTYLGKAVLKAYEEFVPQGYTPSYFIYLTVDPGDVDVNIHPTKTEVKFEDESLVFQIVYACVREALGRNSFGASIDFDTASAVSMPVLTRSFEDYKGSFDAPAPDFDSSYNPFEDCDTARTSYGDGGSPSRATYGDHVDRSQDYGALFAGSQRPSSQIMIIQGKYILTPSKSGMMAVNIRRAYEKIFFEQALRALERNTPVSASTLFPVEVKLGVAEKLLFDEHAGLLSSLGFDIRSEGPDSVTVYGVPASFSTEEGEIPGMISDLELILSDGSLSLSEVILSDLAQKFASLGASRAEAVTTCQQAQCLIDALFACDNAEYTSSGKRIATIISIDDIDRKFQ